MGSFSDSLKRLVPPAESCFFFLTKEESRGYFDDSIFVWAKPWEFKDSTNIEFQEGGWRVYLRDDVYLCKEPKDTALCGLLEPVCALVPAPTCSELINVLHSLSCEVTLNIEEGWVTAQYHSIANSNIYIQGGETVEDAVLRLWFTVNKNNK